MKVNRFFSFIAFFMLFFVYQIQGQYSSKAFQFQFENKTLNGFIETPQNKVSKAVVLLIPGYGKTNFASGRSYSRLRKKLLEFGLTVVTWDKMGCGNSEGVFDANQPVDSSAREALEAIKTIKNLNIAGSEKIGLWGVSRAGWICPIINDLYPVDFWISVSGVNDKENFGYLVKSNLTIAGRNKKDVDRLYNSWMLSHKIFATGGSYEESTKALQPLLNDSLSRKLFGYKKVSEITEEGRKRYQQNQKTYQSKGRFDYKYGLWSYMDDFDELLSKIDCPILALFGEKDSQVDWKLTKTLYEKTYQKKGNLTVQTFSNCNHNLQKCKTGAYREDLSEFNWAYCDGYFDTMKQWLQDQKFID